MASFALTSPVIYVHDTDFTGFSNKVLLDTSAAVLDVTPFGSTAVKRIGGLKSAALDFSGFWESTPDLSHFTDLGVAARVATVSPTGVELDPAYFMQAGRFKYDQFGKVGDAAPFAVSMLQTDDVTGLLRGQLAKTKGNVSATGQLGSIMTTLGAVGATQFLYAAFHVFTAGTTITVQVQSAVTNFATITTRATIGPITTAGGTFLTRVAGPITDTFWRLNVSNITGTFSVAGAVAIGS